MEEIFRRYPIGIQNFELLRRNNCVYVDKTRYIYRLANTNQVYFLSRPAVSAKVCFCLLWKPISKGKENCFKGWP